MQNYKSIHETVLRDIVDIAQGVKDSDEVQKVSNYNDKNSWKSIANKAEALTLVFPVLASRNISFEAAAMIAKAIERKAVTMLQMLFSAIQISDAQTAFDYIGKFHSNLDIGSMTVDKFMDIMDDFVQENTLITEAAQYEAYENAKRDLQNLDFYFEFGPASDSSLDEYKIITVEGTQLLIHEAPTPRGERVDRDSLRSLDQNLRRARENMMGARDRGDNAGMNRFQRDINNITNARTRTQADIDYRFNGGPLPNDPNAQTPPPADPNNNNYVPEAQPEFVPNAYERAQMNKNIADTNKSKFEIESRRLLDGDVKKANELVPTLMYINWVSVSTSDQNTKSAVNSTAVIGIKAKLYAIDSQDIMNRLKLKYNDKNIMLNLIKAGTREISFFRDFVFALDNAKLDAISQSRRGSSSKIWKLLERRAIKSKLRRSFFMTNDAAAISTLVISQEEVEYLKKTEYIDVENPKIINGIMDAYNLMGFVIVDESLEIAKFLFDTGDDLYEILTFNNLEREARDNSTKKIINLMSKMSR